MEVKVEHCRSCGAPIVWVKTKLGKHMPVEAEPSVEFAQMIIEYDPTKHVSHFATCPNAAKHRKTK